MDALTPHGPFLALHLRELQELLPHALVLTYWALGLLGVFLLASVLRDLHRLFMQLLQRLASVESRLEALAQRFSQAEEGRTSAAGRLSADLGALHEQVRGLGQRSAVPEAPRAAVGVAKSSPIGAEERASLLAVAETVANRARQRELPAATADLAAASAAMQSLWHLQLPELEALRDRWPGRSDRLLNDAQRAIQDGDLLIASGAVQQLLRSVDLPVIGEKEAARMVVAAVIACGSKVEGGGSGAPQQLLAAWRIRTFSPRPSDEFDPAKHRPVGSLKGTAYDHRQIVRLERPGYQLSGGDVIELAWVIVGG